MSTAIDLLTEARHAGVSIGLDEGDLVAEGPLTDELVERLRQHKAELLSLLESTDIEAMTENAIEHFNERSAIAEYDGELSRTEAERQAASRVFEVLLTCNDGQWFPLLMQPGDTLADAKAWCVNRFGPEKFVAARLYRPGGGA